MVLWSLPFTMNYDNRIKERSLTSQPLIDINLPRTPSVKRLHLQGNRLMTRSIFWLTVWAITISALLSLPANALVVDPRAGTRVWLLRRPRFRRSSR